MTTTVILAYIILQGGTAGSQSQDGSAYTRPHIFTPGVTDDVGTYICLATVIVVSNYVSSGTAQLSINSKPCSILHYNS